MHFVCSMKLKMNIYILLNQDRSVRGSVCVSSCSGLFRAFSVLLLRVLVHAIFSYILQTKCISQFPHKTFRNLKFARTCFSFDPDFIPNNKVATENNQLGKNRATDPEMELLAH